MSDYILKSDFEINFEVAKRLGFKLCEGQHYKPKVSYWEESCKTFDGCNNASDAWLVVDDIFETLNTTGLYDLGLGMGETNTTLWKAQMVENKCGKFRAAMIVFLMAGDKS